MFTGGKLFQNTGSLPVRYNTDRPFAKSFFAPLLLSAEKNITAGESEKEFMKTLMNNYTVPALHITAIYTVEISGFTVDI